MHIDLWRANEEKIRACSQKLNMSSADIVNRILASVELLDVSIIVGFSSGPQDPKAPAEEGRPPAPETRLRRESSWRVRP
jgi:hypothetical protein